MTGNTSQNKALECRDAKTGRFVTGNNGGGRKLGSRNKRGAFSLLGLAAVLALPTTVLTTSDAEAQAPRLTSLVATGAPRLTPGQLTTEFLDDLYAKWQKHGPDVLERVIRDDPAVFLRTVAQILPTEIDAALNVNAGSDFDGMENVSDILQKVADEAGPDGLSQSLWS
jgi:hypothetical protein